MSVDNVVIGLVILDALERATRIRCSRICNKFPSVNTHQLCMVNDHSNHVPDVAGTVPPASSAESREIGRSVMESSECGESKSDLGLGIIDTACLFCVAGSDWWASCKILLVDIGLKHEIHETREAERYKFGDGGTLVSSIRVTVPELLLDEKEYLMAVALAWLGPGADG